MKASLFNFEFHFDGQFSLLYNSRTNALLKVGRSVAPEVQSLLNEKSGQPPVNRDSKLASELMKGGFLAPDGVDEIGELKVAERAHRFSDERLGLTVCTTLNCNMACHYCYQKKQSRAMSGEVRHQLIRFVAGYSDRIKRLQIAWFGGEPLLAPRVIFELSDAFQSLSQKAGFGYEAGIITNGYLLTRSMAEELRQRRVSNVQVTLDGPREVHDARRPLKNGRGTFETIVRNLQDSVDLFDSVNIRVNVDKNNCSRVEELVDDLDRLGLRRRVGLYFGQVDAATAACRDNSHNCFPKEDFADVQVDLGIRALRKRLAVSDYPTAGLGCCAICLSSLVVDPLGSLYKCYNTIGVASERVGDIAQGPEDQLLNRWLSHDLFADPECLNCAFLPLCLGECPYIRVQDGRRECPPVRYNLEAMVKLEYLRSLMVPPHNPEEESHGRQRPKTARTASRAPEGI